MDNDRKKGDAFLYGKRTQARFSCAGFAEPE
jgi:hypothetical protein